MSLLNDDELFAALDANIQSITNTRTNAESYKIIVSIANTIEQAVIAKLAAVSVEATAWAHRETGLVVLAKEIAKTSRNEERIKSGEFDPLYQAEAIAAARVQAIEEAAKICECQWSTLEERDAGIEFAEAIRELIGGKDGSAK